MFDLRAVVGQSVQAGLRFEEPRNTAGPGCRGRARDLESHMCYIAPNPIAGSLRMSTTTIRLPEDLKARVAKAAEAAGTTAHGFILEAIAEKAEQAERRADFHAEAERRWAEFLDTGESIPWEDMRRYLTGRIQGKDMPRPVPRKFAK